MNNCVDTIPSNCIPWNGPSIPCLGLCRGDSVSDIIVKLATKVCEVAEPENLSTLSLQCLYDMFSTTEPSSHTIKNVLQLLVDNQCSLKDLIDNLQSSNSGSRTFVVNLKCLLEKDSFGNPLPYTQQSVSQTLINEICLLKVDNVYLKSKVLNLQEQIDNLDLNPVVIEAKVVTCINPALLPVSQQVKNTSKSFCDYKSLVGQPSDISTTLSRICPDWNTRFQSLSGWITNPINYMQQMNNVFLVLCNVIGRVENIENTCCAPNCDNVIINFSVEVIGSQVSLRFRDLDGTNIPSGWINNGSTLTITSSDGLVTNTVNIPIAQNYISDTISLSGFTINDNLTFLVNAKMKNGSVTCSKIISKNWKYITDAIYVTPITGSISSNSKQIRITLGSPAPCSSTLYISGKYIAISDGLQYIWQIPAYNILTGTTAQTFQNAISNLTGIALVYGDVISSIDGGSPWLGFICSGTVSLSLTNTLA